MDPGSNQPRWSWVIRRITLVHQLFHRLASKYMWIQVVYGSKIDLGYDWIQPGSSLYMDPTWIHVHVDPDLTHVMSGSSKIHDMWVQAGSSVKPRSR